MSIFGTLGRKGRRKASVTHDLSLGREQSEPTLFKSTPNLHKLDNAVEAAGPASCESPFDSPSGIIYFDYEKNPRTPIKLSPSDGSPRGHGTDGSASSLSSMSAASHDSKVGTTPVSGKNSLSSLRGFVSMVSMASGVKKSKSMRRKVFNSAIHLRPTDQNLSLSDREGVIHEDIAGYSSNIDSPCSYSTHHSSNIKTSQSVPNMEGSPANSHFRSPGSDELDPSVLRRRFNGEPGVESSSSSLSSMSTNQSVSENDSFITGRLRASSSDARTAHVIEDRTVERRKLMLQAAKKFNSDPKKGIEFLVVNECLDRTPESIAQFLKDGEQLSKSAIGNYLGEHHEFNLEVLQAFVELHDFTNVLLVEALRQFLWSFRLPGEAQKIDRMMECFAKRYTQLNPTLFANSDTCYLLSFAIIMLNTSLHNPNVKEKPTLEQFIQMNRDIDNGQPLDRKFIASLYNSILTEPFQIPPEDGNDLMLTFFNPAIEGWLYKQSGRYKTWKRRWFILSNNCLYYFLFTTDKDPRGIIPLENIKVKHGLDMGKEFAFTLYKESSDPRMTEYIKSCKASDGKLTAGKHVRYHLATKTKEDRDRWIDAITQNSSDHNFYTILAQKKSRLEAAEKGTLKRNRNISTSPQKKPSVILNSPGAVRKSQIGLPLTRLDLAKSASSIPDFSDLVSPDLPFKGRNPHEYFIKTASTTNLTGSEEIRSPDSETSSQLSFEVYSKRQPGKSESDILAKPYSTSSLPRTKSRRNHNHQQPIRKFSLPPTSLPNRLTSKVEYLTAPGIRISVEDTNSLDRKESVEKVIINGNSVTYLPNVSTTAVSSYAKDETNISESMSSQSRAPNPQNTTAEPSKNNSRTEIRRTSSLILALKDFADAMQNLEVPKKDTDEGPGEEDEWAEMESLSLGQYGGSGLTKQCLRSSFKSKRSRYRHKQPRKHYRFSESKNNSQTTVIPDTKSEVGSEAINVPEDEDHIENPLPNSALDLEQEDCSDFALHASSSVMSAQQEGHILNKDGAESPPPSPPMPSECEVCPISGYEDSSRIKLTKTEGSVLSELHSEV